MENISNDNGATISLIVCTRNRAGALAQCLQQIAQQSLDPTKWELVIVDNGSSDETPEVIRRFVSQVAFPVLQLREETPGQGRARNLGMAHASAPLLAFTDDDCYPAPDFLERLLDVFQDETLGYIGGRILLFDPTDARLTIREDLVPFYYHPYDVVQPGVIQGANLALRRSVVNQVGNFDPRLGPGTPYICDDAEICARASAAGWRGGYFPEPLVYHHHGRKPGRSAKRLQKTYDFGRGAYFMRFILRKDTRGRYLAAWTKRLLALYRQGPGFSSRVREIIGAVHFLLHHRHA